MEGKPIWIVVVIALALLMLVGVSPFTNFVSAFDPKGFADDVGISVDQGTIGDGGGVCPDGTCNTGETYESCPEDCSFDNSGLISDETPSEVSNKIAEKIYEDMIAYGDDDEARKTAYGLYENGGKCVNIPGVTGSAKWCILDYRNIISIYNGNIPDTEVDECNELKETCLNLELGKLTSGDQTFCGKWWSKDKDGNENNIIFANEKIYSEGSLITCSSNDGTPGCSCGYYSDSTIQDRITNYKYDGMVSNVKGIVDDDYNDPSYLSEGFSPSSRHYMLTLDRDTRGDTGIYDINYYMVLDNADNGEMTSNDVATLIANKYNAGDGSAENLGRSNLAGLFTPLTRTIIDISFTSKSTYGLGELRDLIKSKLSYSYTTVALSSDTLCQSENIYSCLSPRISKTVSIPPTGWASSISDEDALDNEPFKTVNIDIIPNKFSSIMTGTIKENQKYRIVVTKFLFHKDTTSDLFYVDKKIVIMPITENTE